MKLAPPLEITMHVALERLLCLSLNPEWLYTHIPSGEYRDKVTAARLKAMGLKAGWPDFIFMGPGKVFFLELKRKGGKPSEAQREFEASLQTVPNRYRSLAGAARAAGLLRHDEDARAYPQRLLALTQDADSTRPAILAARAYLANRSSRP